LVAPLATQNRQPSHHPGIASQKAPPKSSPRTRAKIEDFFEFFRGL
jgi:hypothetical protein